jgi:hypothetical protein
MTKDLPMVCSLDRGELRQRLAEIAAVGAESLIDRSVDGDRHLLRFRSNPIAYRQLEGIVAAEAKCCSFLDLSLARQDDEIVLSIAAPEDAQALAAGLSAAFAGTIA